MSSTGEAAKREGKGGSASFPRSADQSSSGPSEHPAPSDMKSEKSFHDDEDVSMEVHNMIDNWITKSSLTSPVDVSYLDIDLNGTFVDAVDIVWKNSSESVEIQEKCVQYLKSLLELLRKC